jgi:acetyl esterase/lipase
VTRWWRPARPRTAPLRVACRATGTPEGEHLAEAVLSLDLDRLTTATSALLLRLAADGWCIDEVAAYLAALAHGGDTSAARRRLLGVGHSSGAGLLAGIHRVIRADERHDASEVVA